MSPVGFLDDSPQLEGKRLDGYPIYGGHWVLPRLLKTMKIDQILVSDGTVKPEVLTRLKEIARIHGIPILRLTMQLENVSSVTRQPHPTQSFEIPEEQTHSASEIAQPIK
jgi:FlaA1/EpsC-like NDP-sugar epimerase